jgi:methylenetetrahydrofolate dehydrogenase (NADP+)/methenyltetrahydrofolate cyclohydrolase
MILLDGKKVAEGVVAKVKAEVEGLKAAGIHPKLVVIQVGEDPASLVYIGQKLKRCRETGIESEHLKFRDDITTEFLVGKIHELNADSRVHGILVQLPLPKHVATPLVMKAIDPSKDADGFTAYNIGKMTLGTEFEHLAPCTPKGVIELLEAYNISLEGKEVVMVGASNIVGKPLAIMMLNRRATVTICHSRTRNLASHTKSADILCVAVGKPGLITADMVKDGVIVIDVGINRLPDGSLCGDVDFEGVSAKASYITPVPGGVGQMTVACLMENIVSAAEKLARS